MPFSSAIFWEIDVLVLDAEPDESDRCLMMDLCLVASPVICSVLVLKVSKIDNFVLKIGEVFNWLWVFLVIVIILSVILRYVFKNGMIELEELQWHLYCIGWLVGLSSTYIVDSHVRVDVLSERLAYRKKLWFELFGILILFLPFVVLNTIRHIKLDSREKDQSQNKKIKINGKNIF